ncbi:hypothetical protein [Subtercola boreus]|nr:hypothetical protein [Subtercola boreus]
MASDERKKYLGMYPKELFYLASGLLLGVAVLFFVLKLPLLSIPFVVLAIVAFTQSIRLRRAEYVVPPEEDNRP